MSNFQVPTEIVILGQPFRVTVHPADDAMFRGAPAEALGSTDLNRQLIRLRGPEDMSEAQARETLLHEVLHGVFYLHGFDRFMSDDHDNCEAFIRVLAPALMAVMRDNPLLVAAVTGDVSVPRSGEIVRTGHEHADDGTD